MSIRMTATALVFTATMSTPGALAASPLETPDDYTKFLLTHCVIDDLSMLSAKAAALGAESLAGFKQTFEQTMPAGGLIMLEHANGMSITLTIADKESISCAALIPAGVLSDTQHADLLEQMKSLFGSMYGAPFDITQMQGGERWNIEGSAHNELQVQIIRANGATSIHADSTLAAN